MDRREMDVYAIDGNVAVVKLPVRRFPGILVQGDTMRILADLVHEALGSVDRTEARQTLNEAYDLVSGFLRVYETALRNEGERLPYVK
jgi:hypothetical protein